MHEPKLLLLDEPTAGVDPQARRDFWDQIHRFADGGMTVMVSTHYMDEAERCHDIAYIFNGDLIARGTGDELIAQSGLVTFEADGAGANKLVAELEQRPGVDMVAPFGQTLHVSGTDRRKLEAAIQPYRRDPYQWREAEPTLEDVFIHLMRQQGARSVDEAA
jgi:ABC-2 type transport system ATP-binding protein